MCVYFVQRHDLAQTLVPATDSKDQAVSTTTCTYLDSQVNPLDLTCIRASHQLHATRQPSRMDRTAVVWILGANILAFAVLYQRLITMGYAVPFKDHLDAVYEKLGIFHGSYQQCGHFNRTAFIMTSSRVVFPDGVRPGASKWAGST